MRFAKLFGIGLLSSILGATAVEAADLVITVEDVRSDRGLISVAIYDRATGFLKGGAEVRSADIKAAPGDLVVVFYDLPPGRYAAAAFHDENASGDIDTNFLGIPTEGFGFSNGAKAFLGPPAFQEAAVPVDSQAVTELEMSY